MAEEESSSDLPDRFREVMSCVVGPVVVLTATDPQQRPFGTTVSAFASLSLSPPLVLACLDRRSQLLATVRATGRFGVNVLARSQEPLARAFAAKGGPTKFDGVTWWLDSGLPRLPRTVGWLACEVSEVLDGGDHLIVVGRVVDCIARAGDPLSYHARRFGTHDPSDRRIEE